MAQRRLLILSCSARKHAFTVPVEAWKLYDGVAFRVIKRLQREGCMPADVDILILSARHGLVCPTRKMMTYDERMTPTVSVHQAKSNCKFLRHYISLDKYGEVFLNVGRDYLLALYPIETWLPNSLAMTIASGGIGQKLQQLKRWLLNNSTSIPTCSPCRSSTNSWVKGE